MSIHELFERAYAENTGMDEEFPRMHRLSNGSYSLPIMAKEFMYFRNGFEAAQNQCRDPKNGETDEQQ